MKPPFVWPQFVCGQCLSHLGPMSWEDISLSEGTVILHCKNTQCDQEGYPVKVKLIIAEVVAEGSAV